MKDLLPFPYQGREPWDYEISFLRHEDKWYVFGPVGMLGVESYSKHSSMPVRLKNGNYRNVKVGDPVFVTKVYCIHPKHGACTISWVARNIKTPQKWVDKDHGA